MTAPQAAATDVKPPLLTAVWEHPVTRIAVYVALFVGLGLLSTTGLKLAHVRSHALTQYIAVVGTGLEALIAVAAYAILVKVIERRRMSEAGFAMRGLTTETVSGYIIGIAVMSVTIGLLALGGAYHILGENAQFHPFLPLLMFLFVAIAEETVFRGVVFRVFEYRYGSLVALIVSSLVFGLAHVANVGSMHIPVYQKLIGPIFLCLEMGLLLGAAYMATRRLWLPIGIHWAWNYFEGPVYGTDVSGSGDERNVLVHSSLHGPFLLSGGVFGPEGSIVCAIVGLIFGILLLRVAVRAGQWKPAGEWQPQSEPRLAAPTSG